MSKAAELAALIANVNNGSSLANKNFIINGAMNVSQRGTSTTGLGSANGVYSLDRFFVTVSGTTAGRATISQVADAHDGFANALKLECTTADTSIAATELFGLTTRLEGQNLQSISKGSSDAKPVTVSFYVKGNASATYACEIADRDNSRHCSKPFSVTTSWNRIELNFPADTTGAFDDDNAASMDLNFFLHAGTNFTSGTQNTSAFASTTSANRALATTSFFDSTDRTLFITGLQMEIGEKATAFEHAPFSESLKKCQRYYFRMEGADIDGGKYSTHYQKRSASGYFYTDTAVLAHFYFPVPMRIAPTALEQSGTDNHYDFVYRNTTSTPSGSVIQFNDATQYYCTTYQASHTDNNAQGEAGQQRISNASGYLAWSAEL